MSERRFVDVRVLRREIEDRKKNWTHLGVHNTVVQVNTVDLELLLDVVEAARKVTGSAGFRPDLTSPFGTEVVVVLQDRFNALGDLLDGVDL